MLLRGLTFSVEWSGTFEKVRLGTNGPIWSLSYEAAFYSLFGAAFFLRGILRAVLLALGAVVFGLPILLLVPAWLFGACVWNTVKHSPCRPNALAWGLFLLSPLAIIALKALGVHLFLGALTAQFFAPDPQKYVLFFSDKVLWNTLLDALVASHLYGAYHQNQVLAQWFSGSIKSIVRWAAGASFTLYVIHYPVLHAADAVLPEDMPSKVLVFAALPILVAIIFAEVFERPLPRVRKALQGRRAGREKYT